MFFATGKIIGSQNGTPGAPFMRGLIRAWVGSAPATRASTTNPEARAFTCATLPHQIGRDFSPGIRTPGSRPTPSALSGVEGPECSATRATTEFAFLPRATEPRSPRTSYPEPRRNLVNPLNPLQNPPIALKPNHFPAKKSIADELWSAWYTGSSK
jgi:hypothetical protein